MIAVNSLIPINLAEEKAKFFVDFHYNPQFIYTQPIDQTTLAEYGLPNLETSSLAQQVMEKAYFGRNEADLKALEGSLCSQQQVENATLSFLKLHHLENRFEIKLSHSFVSIASITKDTVKFRLPIGYRRESLISGIYHEIGTHAIRRVNYEQQPWYKKKQQYGFTPYLETEEGLATIHSLLARSYPTAYAVACPYLATKFAQNHSFVETYQYLGKYIQNPERRWMLTFRQKRGLADTGQPGGFTKDLLYFSGLIKVFTWLKSHDFNPTKLYFGKMALDDVNQAVLINPAFQPLLPIFYVSSPPKYAADIVKIGKENFLI